METIPKGVKDLSGLRFGILSVIRFFRFKNYSQKRHALWRCACDCGNFSTVQGTSLKSGATKSCGCLRVKISKSRAFRHGHAGDGKSRHQSPTYRTWRAMIQRCSSSSSPRSKKYYFARGVRVCNGWKSFKKFLSDMGERPNGKSIDRIDGRKGYFPSNCRWASLIEQARNKV